MDVNISLAALANCAESDSGDIFWESASGIEDFLFYNLTYWFIFLLGVKLAEERKKLERILEVERNEDCPRLVLNIPFLDFFQYSATEFLSERFLPTKLYLSALQSSASAVKHYMPNETLEANWHHVNSKKAEFMCTQSYSLLVSRSWTLSRKPK